MNKDELKKLAANSDNIPGIFNYCDRWCERCALSSRCLVYQMEYSAGKSSSSDEDKPVWEIIGDSLKLSLELLEDLENERTSDSKASVTEENELIPEKEIDQQEIEKDIIVQNSKKYFQKTLEWKKENHENLTEKFKEYSDLAKKEEGSDTYLNHLFLLKDHIEIIEWYLTLVPVKSLTLARYELKKESFFDEIQNEKNGTAKLLLIFTRKSILSWLYLMDNLEANYEGSILELLSLLKANEELIEKRYPNAEQFIRPGFDE